MKKKWKDKLCSELLDIPVSMCIFLLVAGILLGNVFVIGTWHWGELIDMDEAIPVHATFDAYDLHYGRHGSVNSVEIRFTDREKLFIDSAAYHGDLEDALERLSSGDKVDLLIHPNSDDIWQMKCGGNTILSFADAKDRVRADNIGFTVLGVFGYAMALLGAVSMLMSWCKKRKNITHK